MWKECGGGVEGVRRGCGGFVEGVMRRELCCRGSKIFFEIILLVMVVIIIASSSLLSLPSLSPTSHDWTRLLGPQLAY